MVVDNGTAQTVAWTMPRPVDDFHFHDAGSRASPDARAFYESMRHTRSVQRNWRSREAGSSNLGIRTLSRREPHFAACVQLGPLSAPDAGYVLRSRRDFIKTSPQSKLFLLSVSFQGFLGHCSFVCKQ